MYEQAMNLLEEVRKIPYPEIKDVTSDLSYANILFDAYAGELSEYTAISQYIYEQLTITSSQDISSIMIEIAKIEMHHLDILGDIIEKLGRDPRYINSLGTPWNANYVRYITKDITEIMKYNIMTEEVAINTYEDDKRYTNNGSIRRMLDRIILDERTHIEIFKLVLRNC